MPNRLQITLAEHEGALVVGVYQRLLDSDACAGLAPAVVAVAKAKGLPVVLDLSQVQFLPSLAIGALLRLQQELKALGQPLVLACVSEPLKKVLATMRLERVVRLAETVKEGVAGVRRIKGTAWPGQKWRAITERQIWIQGGPGEEPKEPGPEQG